MKYDFEYEVWSSEMEKESAFSKWMSRIFWGVPVALIWFYVVAKLAKLVLSTL